MQDIFIKPSILHRLIDENPGMVYENPNNLSWSVEDLKKAVAEELGILFNTRCSLPLDKVEELGRTVYTYGFPDFLNYSFKAKSEQLLLENTIIKTLNSFEPRLKNIQVTVKENPNDLKRLIFVKIEAILYANESNKAICFETIINNKRIYVINETR